MALEVLLVGAGVAPATPKAAKDSQTTSRKDKQMDKRFKHEIWVLHSNGGAVIRTFWVDRAFGIHAQEQFGLEAVNHFADMHRVKDTTLAGYHFSNADGTVVLELH
jgi:hypothetical protein